MVSFIRSRTARVANKLTENTWRPSLTFPFLCLFSSPSLLPPLSSLASLPLEAVPLNPARGSRERPKLPSGVWGRAPAEIEFYAFQLQNMTSGGNSFNDFPENQMTKFQLGGKNVTILHTFPALFQYHLSTAEKRDIWRPGKDYRPGRGTMRPKYGTSREIRDGWQPYVGYSYLHRNLAQSRSSCTSIRLNEKRLLTLRPFSFIVANGFTNQRNGRYFCSTITKQCLHVSVCVSSPIQWVLMGAGTR